MTKYKLVATAAAGIEALVGKELRNMAYEVQVENGKAFFEGDDYDIARTNIWLRTADRIKIIMGQFTAKTIRTRYLNKQRRFLGRKFFQSMQNFQYLVNL